MEGGQAAGGQDGNAEGLFDGWKVQSEAPFHELRLNWSYIRQYETNMVGY
jgi:hypothetical protein